MRRDLVEPAQQFILIDAKFRRGRFGVRFPLHGTTDAIIVRVDNGRIVMPGRLVELLCPRLGLGGTGRLETGNLGLLRRVAVLQVAEQGFPFRRERGKLFQLPIALGGFPLKARQAGLRDCEVLPQLLVVLGKAAESRNSQQQPKEKAAGQRRSISRFARFRARWIVIHSRIHNAFRSQRAPGSEYKKRCELRSESNSSAWTRTHCPEPIASERRGV